MRQNFATEAVSSDCAVISHPTVSQLRRVHCRQTLWPRLSFFLLIRSGIVLKIRMRLHRHIANTLAAGGLTLLAMVGAVSAAAQDATVKAQHGDWQVVCKAPPPGAKSEVCALVQAVMAEDRNNVGLTVYFQKFADGSRRLRVFAPLGVLLPRGVGLKIDDKDIGNAPFLRCNTFTCYSQVVADDKLVDQLKNGKTAIFVIFQTEEAGIGIPISLAGFAEGLSGLDQ